MESTDVLVVGGGVVGVCAAHYLNESGCDVILVESGEIGGGASQGNMGLIVPSHSVPLAAPGVVLQGLKWVFNPDSPFYIKPRMDPSLFHWLWEFWKASSKERMCKAIPLIRDMSILSVSLFDELSKLDRVKFDYQKRGILALYRTEEGQKESQEEASLLASYGLQIDVHLKNVLETILPNLELNALGGIHFKQDGHLDPRKFVQALGAYIKRRGVTIRTQREVTGFTRENDRITVTKTTDEDIVANQVVIATGSWTRALGKTFGINLPIEAAKGYSVTLKRPARWPEIPLMLSESRVAVTPMGEMLRLGGTLELAGMDLSINSRRITAIINAVSEYLPAFDIGSHEIVDTWCGLRPCTPDGLPFLGRSPDVSNLIVAAGHAMIGVSLGPVTGKLVAQIVAGGRTDINLDLLAIDRFAV